MTVSTFKEVLFLTDEIKAAKITKMNVYKVELDLFSLEDEAYIADDIKDIGAMMQPGYKLNKYFDNNDKTPEKFLKKIIFISL
jgi:hypothetical protein